MSYDPNYNPSDGSTSGGSKKSAEEEFFGGSQGAQEEFAATEFHDFTGSNFVPGAHNPSTGPSPKVTDWGVETTKFSEPYSNPARTRVSTVGNSAQVPTVQSPQTRQAQVAAMHTQATPSKKKVQSDEEGFVKSLVEWIVVFAGAIFLAFVIRTFLLQAFWIPTPSMTETLMVNDRILVNKVNYRVSDIERFDVVVFRNPDETDENSELVKRVIGLPGETFEMQNGTVLINGVSIGEEPYISPEILNTDSFDMVQIPEDSYFVLGDNRTNSSDSRSTLGPIKRELVVGKAFMRFWPVDRIGRIQ